MKVVFRADAAVEIGTGHLMRCITLADELSYSGVKCCFVCREETRLFGELITQKGHEVLFIPDCATAEEDANSTQKCLGGRKLFDWLVVDHYGLDMEWERKVRKICKKILVIDDLNNRSHDCEVLVDQNLKDPEKYSGLIPDNSIRLVGPKYALLRRQFLKERERVHRSEGNVSRVLLFFGGTDPEGMTLKVIQMFRELNRKDLFLDVIVGKANPDLKLIQSISDSLPNSTLKLQVDNMAEVMSAADIYIGAGGTTSWERCCMGLPSLVLATADNQVEQSRSLALAGTQVYLGKSSDISMRNLSEIISKVILLPELLVHLSECAFKMVDGKGVQRVRAVMTSGEVVVRDSKIEDSEMILEWRNHDDVRRYSFQSEKIGVDEHRKWYENVLADPFRIILIAEENNNPVGVIRYDLENEHEANVSVFVKPGQAGRYLGKKILAAGEGWIKEKYPEVNILKAVVKKENIASKIMFERDGFGEIYSGYEKSIKVAR